MGTTTNLGTTIKSDALMAIDPVVSQFFDNIAANPTTLGVMLQVNALQAQLLAAGPSVEGVVIKDTAVALKAKWKAAIAPSAPVTAAAAPAA